jgi:hypothetical protein
MMMHGPANFKFNNTSPFVSLDVASQQTERILAKFGLEGSTVKLLGTKL